MLFPVVIFLSFFGVTVVAQDCKAAAKCANPAANLITLMTCQLTTLFDPAGLTTIGQLLSQQTCNGSTIEDIGSNFLSTAQKGASSATLSKLSSVLIPFQMCLSSKGSSFSTALTQVGTAFKSALGTMYTNLQKPIMKNYNGKCTTTPMYNAVFKNFCPKFTPALIQKVIDAGKKAMGSSWTCVATKLSPTVFNMTNYKV